MVSLQEPQPERVESTAAHLLEEAEKKEKIGDELFKELKYAEGIEIYKEAAKVLTSEQFKIGSEEFRKMLSIKNSLMNKISTNYMKLRDFKEALFHAKRVVLIDSENLEALIKIGFCEEQLGNNLAAYEALVHIIQIHNQRGMPVPPEIIQIWTNLKNKVKAEQIATLDQNPKQGNIKNGEIQNSKTTKEVTFWKKYPILRQAFLIVPSSFVAVLAVNYVTKEDVKSPKSLASSVVLAGFLLGVISDKSYTWKGVFGLFAAGFLGFLYKFSRK